MSTLSALVGLLVHINLSWVLVYLSFSSTQLSPRPPPAGNQGWHRPGLTPVTFLRGGPGPRSLSYLGPLSSNLVTTKKIWHFHSLNPSKFAFYQSFDQVIVYLILLAKTLLKPCVTALRCNFELL